MMFDCLMHNAALQQLGASEDVDTLSGIMTTESARDSTEPSQRKPQGIRLTYRPIGCKKILFTIKASQRCVPP